MNKWLEALGWREVQAAIGLALTQGVSTYLQTHDLRGALVAAATVLFGAGGLAVFLRKAVDALSKLALTWVSERLRPKAVD